MRHAEPLVRGYAVTHPPGEVLLPTEPGWDQVLYATSGAFIARTAVEAWTVPPHRALCLDDGTRVRVSTRTRTALRCLYLRADLGGVGRTTRVIDVGDLVRELLTDAVARCPLDLTTAADAALVTLLIDRLSSSPTAALHLPLPTDDRAVALMEVVLRDPSTDLASAIAGVGASRRTLERRVLAETSLTLAGWHRRARVLAAIEAMADGASVSDAASAVGYSTPSSFVAAFRSELGTTPRRFMQDRRWAASADGASRPPPAPRRPPC